MICVWLIWFFSDGIGKPKKPPCVSCHHMGAECVLAKSRRGTKSRAGQQPSSRSLQDSEPPTFHGGVSAPLVQVDPSEKEPSAPDYSSDDDGYGNNVTVEDLCVELRNPSDALHILARSDETRSNLPTIGNCPSGGRISGDRTHSSPQSSKGTAASLESDQVSGTDKHVTTALDDYELVKRGLLIPSILPELLNT